MPAAGFNGQSARVIERPSGDGECPTGRRAWGLEDGAQGALSRPEWLRGCGQTKFAAALRQRRVKS